MIRYIRRKEIDIAKYDACIETAINARIYAYSWYLDIVADNWDALVLDDYKAVMPLPFLRLKKMLFFKRIAQPNFCQQLGVFSVNNLSEIVNEFMIQFSALNFKNYSFNSFYKFNNNSFDCKVIEKVNYELGLVKSYQEIQKKYSKNLKRNLKKAYEIELVISSEITISQFLSMKENNKKHKIRGFQYKRMKCLMEELIQLNLGSIYGVYFENKLIASAFFVEEKHRITHLFSATTYIGKKNGGIPYLFDTTIKNNATKDMVFDFEGSMIPNVARFFKSFGAQKINYYSLEK